MLSKTCFAGLPLLFLVLLYIVGAQVKGEEACRDIYSTCSDIASTCRISHATRILCEKTCKVCVAEWMGWLQWNDCSKSCGGGIRKRKRKCSIKDQCQDLKSENQQTEKCKEHPCLGPEVRWGEWSSWGTCSKRCGKGKRKRKRTCSVHKQCQGKQKELEKCTETLCTEWMDWLQWNDCSKSCGGGIRKRKRKCPIKGQCQDLKSENKQTEKCKEHPCLGPEVGWSEWSSWETCSKRCGNGERKRKRTCSGHKQCKGKSKEIENCAEPPCPDNVKRNATYLVFAVDDSGSMAVEIKSVKLWIEECIKGNIKSCGDSPSGGWIITSFNDPDIGVVVGPTKNSQHVLDAAKSYFAHGGGDCPEMAFTGLENVIKAVPSDASACKVFLLTDAAPKDVTKAESMAKQCKEKGCKVIPVLSNCCGTCPPVEDSVKDARDYRTVPATRRRKKRSTDDDAKTLFYQLSEKTGGKIFVVDKPTSPESFVEFLQAEITLGFCATSDLAGPNAKGYRCEEDCVAMKMCWDKSVRKCYCAGTIPCERRPIIRKESRCPEWTGWSSLSTCSHTCGGGTMQRRGRCSIEGKCRYMRPGSEQSHPCNVKRCPEWKKWNTWESCSKTCRKGQQKRIRYCSVLNECKGNSMEARNCVEERNCRKYTDWSPWSSCDRLCGKGKKRRERSCLVDGGCGSMTSKKEQIKNCNIKKCFVDCDVKVTRERCIWIVIRPSRVIKYTDAKEICRKNGSTLAVFVNNKIYNSTMKAIHAKIPPKRTLVTYIWTGMTMNDDTWLKTMDHPPHRSWYDSNTWHGAWNQKLGWRFIVLAFQASKYGMFNWHSQESLHGVICQTKQPTGYEP